METLIKVAQFILSLSILVTLHELGHYITARMFKTRVEKFYLFFDFMFPFPTVLNFALFKKKIGDTEYGLGWFPLGGYVKIAGMIDESMDEEAMKLPPQPDEFRSKKPYQRLIIMLGGIIVNILLAFVIYAQLLFWVGDSYLPVENVNVKGGFAAEQIGQAAGLKDGDKIISYNGGTHFKQTRTIGIELLINLASSIEVERDGKVISLPINTEIHKQLMAGKGGGFASPLIPSIIDSLVPGNPFAKAGAKEGDRIIAVNDTAINYYHEVRMRVPNYKGKALPITVLRGNDTLTVSPVVSSEGTIGFISEPIKYFEIKEVKYTLLQSFPAGVNRAWETLVNYIKQFRLVFNRELKGYKKVGSFITIAEQFSPTWDWYSFWQLTAFLSVALAFVNLLPIPALDGGHALFTIYEMISGRAPSEKFLERAQVVGMIIIFGLMIFALGNDFLRKIFGEF